MANLQTKSIQPFTQRIHLSTNENHSLGSRSDFASINRMQPRFCFEFSAKKTQGLRAEFAVTNLQHRSRCCWLWTYAFATVPPGVNLSTIVGNSCAILALASSADMPNFEAMALIRSCPSTC